MHTTDAHNTGAGTHADTDDVEGFILAVFPKYDSIDAPSLGKDHDRWSEILGIGGGAANQPGPGTNLGA
jgi:hypothetical protein